MSTELTPELRQALADADGPLELIDPVTRKAYVLVSAELYQRLQGLIGDETDVAGMAALLADLSPEDWEDASNYDLPQP
jgi:hypothetical protein